MKKLLILSLALALSLSLAACGDGGGNTSGGGLGDITVGDSSNPSNNSGDSTSPPDTTQSVPETLQQPSGTTIPLVGIWLYSSAGSDDTFYQDSCKSGTFAYTPGVKYPRNARLFVYRTDGTGTRVLITESAISSAQFTYTASSSEITMSLNSNTNHHSDGSVNVEQYNPPNTRTERYKISVGDDGQTFMEMTLLDNWLSNHFDKIQ